jgi:two-component system phosphate regulon sensor histidine kinase PhoR
MHWLNLFSRTLAVVVLAAAAGWYFDLSLEFALAAGLGVLLYVSHRIWLLLQWLDYSSEWPLDLGGIWGELGAKIYQQRLSDREKKEDFNKQRDRVVQALASMRDGIVMVDQDGALHWCNEAASNLLGIELQSHAGQDINALIGSKEFTRHANAGEHDDTLLIKVGSDPERSLQVVLTSFGEGDKLVLLRDATGRAHMDQVRRDFVGNVSHELRTPLTVISGYLDTFLSGSTDLPTRLVKPLEQMLQQAVRMESLLKDLLWLSRIESDEREEKRELIDIPAMLGELGEEIAGTHPDRRLILRLSAREKVSGDYRELYSAVSNLVQNAMKYSADDTPVTVGWRMGIGGYHLSVSDLGRGIGKEHIPRLTERFYRVDDSRSSHTGGTGLGLAIVKHVAASHDAQLQIESEVGRGSTFALVFPYRQS